MATPPDFGRQTVPCNLNELLVYEDSSFVVHAYQAILGRDPDPEGLQYYLSRLRKGTRKTELLAQMRSSAEGEAHGSNIVGLDALVARYRLKKLPLVGAAIRTVSACADLLQRPPADSAGANFSMARAIAIQRRVIGALVLREIITRYGRHNIGFMWLFVEPMLFTLGIVGLWTATKAAHGSNLPIAAFALTGYASVLLWRNAANRCAQAITPNLSLLYHRNVRVIDLFAARLLLELAGVTISIAVLMLSFMAIGWIEPPADILRMLVAWFLLSWFAVSLGLIVGALSERSEMVDRIWHTLTYLLFPLSGAVFMVDWLPKQAQEFVLSLPMVHGTEMMRHGYFGEVVRTYEDPAYLAICNVLLMLIGLAMVRDASRHVEPE